MVSLIKTIEGKVIEVGHIVTLINRERSFLENIIRWSEQGQTIDTIKVDFKRGKQHLLNILEILFSEGLIYHCETIENLTKEVWGRPTGFRIGETCKEGNDRMMKENKG